MREHLRLDNVLPPIIVEVSDIDAHSRVARVLEPCSTLVRKRAVLIVDVEYIVRRDIVRDIYVGPAISVQIGNGDTKTESRIAAYAEQWGGRMRDTSS